MTTEGKHAIGFETIKLSSAGPVRRLILNRPRRHNAQTPKMWSELAQAVRLLGADDDVRAVVLAGEGRSFSSGLDQSELGEGGFLREVAVAAALDPLRAHEMLAGTQAVFTAIKAAPFPVVAAVKGYAIGAGLQLALACDFRVVAEDAHLSVAEVGRGVVPDLGATAWLPRLVGTERALDLILTAREFDGCEAGRLGLAIKVVASDEVDSAAYEYATILAAAPRHALAYAKAATLEPDQATSMNIAADGMLEALRSAFPAQRQTR